MPYCSVNSNPTLMPGMMISELSRVGELDRELSFLTESEDKIDELLERIVDDCKSNSRPSQLDLFRQADDYLTNNKTLHLNESLSGHHCD